MSKTNLPAVIPQPTSQRTSAESNPPVTFRMSTLAGGLAVAFALGIGAAQTDWSSMGERSNQIENGPRAAMLETLSRPAGAAEVCEGCDTAIEWSRELDQRPFPNPIGQYHPGAPSMAPEAKSDKSDSPDFPQKGEKDWVPQEEMPGYSDDAAGEPEPAASPDSGPIPGPAVTAPADPSAHAPTPYRAPSPAPAPEMPEIPDLNVEPKPAQDAEAAPSEDGPELAEDDGDVYMECSRVGDAMHCEPISIEMLAENAVQTINPVDVVGDMAPTGRVDRDVSQPPEAMHDPHRPAPDPDEVPTYGPIERGDTVLDIAQQHFDLSRHDIYDAAAAIVRENPHAFRNGNPDDLMIGTTLEIPDEDVIHSGSWASLIKSPPPVEVTEESFRPLKGVAASHMTLNVQPVPLQEGHEYAQQVSTHRADGAERSHTIMVGGEGMQPREAERQRAPGAQGSGAEQADQLRRELQAIEAQLQSRR
ncbi:hypothetical protein TK90_2843 (plasmid) [Thioalkalivibrio sp. K90mix]|uniref:hypothetical protein n=1 Tax=Thioalkalivibrio sp. (strain K90mix) TaxID=396595 RepID=UPI000195A843|nr:hypothetical protein [Thioalkalivibrio sp. K90mix]ADC73328.1 hypothetical protein TK90_2843 [Thioalkalivibrio sp. K90mix]